MQLQRLDSIDQPWDPLDLSQNDIRLSQLSSHSQQLVEAIEGCLNGLHVVVLLYEQCQRRQDVKLN